MRIQWLTVIISLMAIGLNLYSCGLMQGMQR